MILLFSSFGVCPLVRRRTFYFFDESGKTTTLRRSFSFLTIRDINKQAAFVNRGKTVSPTIRYRYHIGIKPRNSLNKWRISAFCSRNSIARIQRRSSILLNRSKLFSVPALLASNWWRIIRELVKEPSIGFLFRLCMFPKWWMAIGSETYPTVLFSCAIFHHISRSSAFENAVSNSPAARSTSFRISMTLVCPPKSWEAPMK